MCQNFVSPACVNRRKSKTTYSCAVVGCLASFPIYSRPFPSQPWKCDGSPLSVPSPHYVCTYVLGSFLFAFLTGEQTCPPLQRSFLHMPLLPHAAAAFSSSLLSSIHSSTALSYMSTVDGGSFTCRHRTKQHRPADKKPEIRPSNTYLRHARSPPSHK